MTQTPFQRALDAIEDRIFRLTPKRRAWCLSQTRQRMMRRMPADYVRANRAELERRKAEGIYSRQQLAAYAQAIRSERRTMSWDGRRWHHHALVDFANDAPRLRDRAVVSVAQSAGVPMWWLPFLLVWNSLTSGVDVAEYALDWWVTQSSIVPRWLIGPMYVRSALTANAVRRLRASWKGSTVDGAALLPAALRVGLAATVLLVWWHAPDAHTSIRYAALGAAGVIEVQTGGSDTNGGGYEGGGTDYTQQASAQVNVADLVTTAASTTVTSATGSFTSAMTGNWVYIQGGTGAIAAKWFKFTYVNSTTGTLDTSTGIATGTGATFKLGGAFASPGQASAVGVASNTYHIKAGAGYTITTATTNTSGGCFAPAGGAATTTATTAFGYGSTRGDMTQAVLSLKAGVSTATVVSFSGNYFMCIALQVDCANNTSGRAFSISSAYRCKASNCKNGGFFGVCVRCEASGSSVAQGGIVLSAACVGCEAYGNTSLAGFVQTNSSFCLSYGHTGASGIGFTVGGSQAWVNCTAYGNGASGYICNSSARGQAYVNLLAVNNSAYGVDNTSGGQLGVFLNFATYNNTSGATNNVQSYLLVNPITLTGDPFTNAASNDFSLNNTAGAGAACRAAGFPGIYPRGTTTGYLDAGAVQHQDAGGGLRLPLGMDGGLNG